jgi:FHS family L-fucose permease-like MFS transporter
MIKKQSYLVPFILVTSLFFFWGFAHSILDVLNKHFQDALVISKSRSALVQAVVYGGYFLMALPAGSIIKKWGYRTGVVTGLILYGIGALLFIPGERIMSFEFFLLSLFIIGCGLTCLETAANPYITVLGDKDSGPQRLNLAQSFNGLGWICGPLVGGLLIFTGRSGNDGSVALPYAIIGIVVLVVAVVFSRIKLPEIVIKDEENVKGGLWNHAGFIFGVVALFFYVAAQTGINSFFINYVTENIPAFSPRTAALILSFGGMGLFMTGRMGGSWIMKYIKAEKILMFCAIGASICMIVVTFIPGKLALAALLLCYLFESIMFPTIFALAIRGLDSTKTKRASSFLIMSIVGGAIAPVLMGAMGEKNMAIGFVIPMVCFIIILIYTFWLRKQTMRSAVY